MELVHAAAVALDNVDNLPAYLEVQKNMLHSAKTTAVDDSIINLILLLFKRCPDETQLAVAAYALQQKVINIGNARLLAFAEVDLVVNMLTRMLRTPALHDFVLPILTCLYNFPHKVNLLFLNGLGKAIETYSAFSAAKSLVQFDDRFAVAFTDNSFEDKHTMFADGVRKMDSSSCAKLFVLSVLDVYDDARNQLPSDLTTRVDELVLLVTTLNEFDRQLHQ